MKRSPIRTVSTKRRKDLETYRAVRDTITPNWTHCARCEHPAGDLEPHHPYLRGTGKSLWKLLVVIPLCRDCHEWVHDNPTAARHCGLLVKIRS